MGTQRKNPDSLKSMLADIRNDGMRDTQYIKKLLKKLTGEDVWTDEQCRRFYEALLREYIKDEQYLNLMLAVSGIDEKYGGYLVNASKRRGKYFEHLKANDPTETRDDADSLRKGDEEHCLEYLAKKLEEVIKNGKGVKLVERLIHEEEEEKEKDMEENAESFEQSCKCSSHAKEESNITNSNYYGEIKAKNVFIGDNNQANSTETTNNTNNSCNVWIKIKNFIKIHNKITVILCSITVLIFGYYKLSFLLLPPVTDIVLPPSELKFELDPNNVKKSHRTIQVAIFPPESVGAKLSYTSDNPEVATVTSAGEVLAQGKWEENEEFRTTEITIQAESGATAKQIVVVKKSNGVPLTYTDDDFKQSYTLQTSVRPADTKGNNWTDQLEVNVGDEVEYQIEYENTSDEIQYNVMIRDLLPDNVEYIPGSTRLWNEEFTEATVEQDDLVTERAVNIGNYAPGATALVRFNAKIVDKNLECGSNTMVNWGHGTVNGEVIQDYVNVHLDKE